MNQKHLTNKTFVKNSWLCCFLCAVVLGIFSCAKDKTVEEYQAEKNKRNFTVLDSVSGTYSGIAKNKSDNQTVGIISIQFEAQTESTASSAGNASNERPILISRISLKDTLGKELNLTINEAFYDSDNKRIRASKSMKAQSGATATSGTSTGVSSSQDSILQLQGTFDVAAFSGSLSTTTFSDDGLVFILKKDSETESATSALSSLKETEGEKSLPTHAIRTFVGTTVFINGSTRPVQVVVTQPLNTLDDDLIELLQPEKKIDVSFSFGRAMTLMHKNAVWKQKNANIMGHTSKAFEWSSSAAATLKQEVVEFDVDCTESEINGKKHLHCKHTTNTKGPFGETDVDEVDPSTIDGTIDASEFESEPTKIETYSGNLTFDDKITKPMKLSLVFGRKATEYSLTELFLPNTTESVNGQIQFADGPLIDISNLVFDRLTSTIVGSYSITSASQAMPVKIDCVVGKTSSDIKQLQCNHYSASLSAPVSSALIISSSSSANAINSIVIEVESLKPITFNGSAHFGNEKLEKARLTLFPNPEIVQDEVFNLFFPKMKKTFTASLMMIRDDVTVSFATLVFDPSRGTLEGTTNVSTSTDTVLVSLRCSGLSSTSEKPVLNDHFRCIYVSSMGSRITHIDF